MKEWKTEGVLEPAGKLKGSMGISGLKPGRMERGAMRLMLLDALAAGARHGYEVMKWVEERTGGHYTPSPGAIYPTLQLLEDEGAVRSRQEGDKRVFELTPAGGEELQAQASRIVAFWERFEAPPPPAACRHEIQFLEEELEALIRTVRQGMNEAVQSDNPELIRRMRLSLQNGREEARSLIAAAGRYPSGAPGEPTVPATLEGTNS